MRPGDLLKVQTDSPFPLWSSVEKDDDGVLRGTFNNERSGTVNNGDIGLLITYGVSASGHIYAFCLFPSGLGWTTTASMTKVLTVVT